jgi:hypothetical protein
MRNKSTKEYRNFPFENATYLICLASLVLPWFPLFKEEVWAIQIISMMLQFYHEGGKVFTPLFVAIFLCNFL